MYWNQNSFHRGNRKQKSDYPETLEISADYQRKQKKFLMMLILSFAFKPVKWPSEKQMMIETLEIFAA